MTTDNHRSIDRLVKNQLESQVPPHVTRRLLGQLRNFRQRLSEQQPSVAEPKWFQRVPAWGMVAAVAACLMILLVWSTRSANPVWAQVVETVHTKPWIHCLQRTTAGEPVELWYGRQQGVFASRSQEFTSYADLNVKTELRYVQNEAVLYRLPLNDRWLRPDFSELMVAFPRGDDEIAFPEPEGAYLSGQDIREVVHDGKKWRDYELTFEPSSSIRYSYVFRVDPQTRLPRSWIRRYADGTEQTFALDYPSSGPANVYALGVPTDAKIVDRVPSDDVDRILSGVQRTCEVVEPYFAIIIDRLPDSRWTDGIDIHRIWRRKNNWRIERAFAPDVELMRDQRHAAGQTLPADDVDRLAWWKQRLLKVRFEPLFVSDGKQGYRFTTRMRPNDLRTTEDFKKASFTVEKIEPFAVYPEEVNPFARFAFHLPESSALMTLGRPTAEQNLHLNVNPAVGPPKTVLVTRTGRRSEQTFRVWVDPTKYVALRWETEDNPGAPNRLGDMISVGIVDELSLSPQRHPFVSKYRWGGVKKAGSEELLRGYSIQDIYRDFKTEIPDAVFTTKHKID